MAEHAHVPDADRQEQLQPAGPEASGDGTPPTVSRETPEADLLEQLTPSGPEPEEQLPTASREPREFIPEADALEQALPADREIFDEDE